MGCWSRNVTKATSDVTQNVNPDANIDALRQPTPGFHRVPAYSIPSFFSLYRNARNVIPRAEAARVLL